MQEPLETIDMLVMIYKTLKEKAEPRETGHNTVIHSCTDHFFELVISKIDGEERLFVGDREISFSMMQLVLEKASGTEFYCRKDNTCENQCPLCTGGEIK